MVVAVHFFEGVNCQSSKSHNQSHLKFDDANLKNFSSGHLDRSRFAFGFHNDRYTY